MFGKEFSFNTTLDFQNCYRCGNQQNLCTTSVSISDESAFDIFFHFVAVLRLVNRKSANLPVCRSCWSPVWMIRGLHMLALAILLTVACIVHVFMEIDWVLAASIPVASIVTAVSYTTIRDSFLGVRLDRSDGKFKYVISKRYLTKFQEEFVEQIYSSESRTFGIIAPHNPGKFFFSDSKLQFLQPELFGLRGLLGRLAAFFCMNWSPRTYLDEQILYGDCCAAVVIETRPLLVAAYSRELDGIVMLKFPEELADEYQLTAGSRLLSSNTYDTHRVSDGDLFPGPRKRTDSWRYFHPIIADFVTADPERLQYCKLRISDQEWQRASRIGLAFRKVHPDVARDGRPMKSGVSALP